MASETGPRDPSTFIENLISSRNRDISMFFPFFLGFNTIGPSEQGQYDDVPRESPDRIILINPFTQGMVVIERSSRGSDGEGDTDGPPGFDSLFGDIYSDKSGRPPASKASIDALPSVEIENGEDDCVVCLEEWRAGEKAKEMPCRHRFHGDCIEKWLMIHGSCPLCRYEMPVDEADSEKKSGSEEGDRGRRREIWVTFAFAGGRRSRVNASSENNENSDSSSDHQEMQG